MQITVQYSKKAESSPRCKKYFCCEKMEEAFGVDNESEFIYFQRFKPCAVKIQIVRGYNIEEAETVDIDFCPFCGSQIDIIDITSAKEE